MPGHASNVRGWVLVGRSAHGQGVLASEPGRQAGLHRPGRLVYVGHRPVFEGGEGWCAPACADARRSSRRQSCPGRRASSMRAGGTHTRSNRIPLILYLISSGTMLATANGTAVRAWDLRTMQ
jgi:hypothetical protein